MTSTATHNSAAPTAPKPRRGLLGWTWFVIKWTFLLAMTAMWWWLIIPAWVLSKVFSTSHLSGSGGSSGAGYWNASERRRRDDDYGWDRRRRDEQNRLDTARSRDFEDRYAAYKSSQW